MTDMVNHPPHYNSSNAECPGCERRIECIDISKFYCFEIGNVIKYIWRAGLKENVSELVDLKKARWYLDSRIKTLEHDESKK